ncbi:MAG: hypothetical protein WCZ90_17820 [Melioribacteraceae bacterium]
MIDLLGLIGSLAKESDFKKRMRLHQGWWRAFVLGENEGKHPMKDDENICNTLLNGEQTKNNFLSNLVKNVVVEVLKGRNDGSAGLVDQKRLYNNLLSSQPLCFNFFAPLYIDKKLALNFLRKYYPEITAVNEVFFEHANAKNKYDNSAFDIAFDVNDGCKKGIIGFECKYTDSFSPTPYRKKAYEEIFQQSNIWAKHYEELTCSKFNQLFRNQLIAESFKQDKQYDFGYLALFCHHKDDEAIKNAEEYKLMLKNEQTHHFQIITYKDFFEQLMKLELNWQMREYYMFLWARYCGLKLSNSAYEQMKENEKGYHRVCDVDEMDLHNKIMVATLEGGVIYSAENEDGLFVIIDESTLSDFLNEQDKKEIGCFTSIYKFVNDAERKSFINKYKLRITETNGI